MLRIQEGDEILKKARGSMHAFVKGQSTGLTFSRAKGTQKF